MERKTVKDDIPTTIIKPERLYYLIKENHKNRSNQIKIKQCKKN